MSNKVIALLLLIYVVLLVLVVGNIADNATLWIYIDIYGGGVSLLAGYRLFKASF